MPPYFLTMRCPRAMVDRYPWNPPPPPYHEKRADVFYQTDHLSVAEHLVKLFGSGQLEAAAWDPESTLSERYVILTGFRDKTPVAFPWAIFEIVDGADLSLARRVLYKKAIAVLEAAGRSGMDIDPESPDDRRRLLLSAQYERARQLEPLVHEELGAGLSAGETGDTALRQSAAPKAQSLNPESTQPLTDKAGAGAVAQADPEEEPLDDGERAWDLSDKDFKSATEIVNKYHGQQIDKSHLIRLKNDNGRVLYNELSRFVHTHRIPHMHKPGGARLNVHDKTFAEALKNRSHKLAIPAATAELTDAVRQIMKKELPVWKCQGCDAEVHSKGEPLRCTSCKKSGAMYRKQ